MIIIRILKKKFKIKSKLTIKKDYSIIIIKPYLQKNKFKERKKSIKKL